MLPPPDVPAPTTSSDACGRNTQMIGHGAAEETHWPNVNKKDLPPLETEQITRPKQRVIQENPCWKREVSLDSIGRGFQEFDL